MKNNGKRNRTPSHKLPAGPVVSERREGDAQFRELMAHLQQVFWVKNAADDAVLYISPAYETICGRTCQSLYDNFQTFLDAVHPEDRARVAGALAGQNATGGFEMEYRIVRLDGTIRWIWARSYPVRDGQGQIIRFAGIAEDITERKSLEQDRARLAAIVEYSEDAIISMSVDCVIISWNRGAELQYGYTAEEIIGCSLAVLFPPDHYDEYLRILKNVRQGKPVAACDTVRRRKDGSLVNTSVNIFPIEVRNREVVGASKISHEVTAIKKLEAQFIEAQKMEVVGQVAAGMAHDFNNLLSVILGCSERMMETLSTMTPMRKLVETIREAAQRAAGLTRRLMVFSRKAIAAPNVLNINEVVVNLDQMLRQLIDDNIDLNIVREEHVGRVKADSGYLGQVLLNLVINARDAMPSGGRLSITTSNAKLDDNYTLAHPGVAPGPYVLLTVSDTGTGITDEVKAHLFEPFFTTKPKGKGTGLGLATCETIVKQCGGHTTVTSAVGQGATFNVYFPAVDEPLDAAQPLFQVGAPLPRGTETLLVVEAERSVRDLIGHILEAQGYTVLRAFNGQDGLRKACENDGPPVRLVITDVNLPSMCGNGVIGRMKLAGPELKILSTSSCVDDASMEPGRVAAGRGYLPKPFTPAELACKVRAMLDQSVTNPPQ